MYLKIFAAAIGSILIALAIFLNDPTAFGVCYPYQTVNGAFCSAPYGYPYGVTLLPFALGLSIASILALFVSRITFRRWSWFTLWYCVAAISLMLLAAASEIDIGFLTVALFDLEKVAWGLATIYGVISVLLLGISDFLIRRRG